MKEIFENRKKLYLFALILFLITSIIFRIIPLEIQNIIMYILFPIYFAVLVFFYTKHGKINWNIPIVLAIIYTLIGYTCIKDNMSVHKVIISYLVGMVPLIIFWIKDRKKKNIFEEKIELTDYNKRIISYLMPAITMIVLEWYYTVCTFNTLTINIDPKAMVIGLILTYSIYFLLLAIFRRTSLANKTYAIAFLVIFIINELRIYYTSDTVQITDILFLQNTGEIVGFADVTMMNAINFILWPTILTIIIFVFLFGIMKRASIKITDKKEIAIKAIASVLILLIMFAPIEFLNKFMTNNIFNIHDGHDYAITASNTRYYKRYGVLPGLYGKFIEVRRHEPANYNETKLKEMLELAEDNNTSWKKPNIIVIFSESFWDVSKLDKIKFDTDVTPNFKRIMNEQKAIQMISPAYGGISSNVEFEILTGGSLNFFSKGYTPYMQLFHKGLSDNNPNIIKELKNNGYKTKILNSSGASMFNCDYIYDIYGVDERNHLYDEIDLGGNYVTDEYLTDKMIEYFDNKDPEEKIFFFTITMGGHMPYYEERYENYDINIVDSPYTKDVNEVIHAYAEGMYLADKQLGRIYDYIQTIDEDTIIVFFGDHLPHLATPDGKDALFTTGFLSDDYNLESVYNQYNTTALIMSNYDIDFDDTNYLSPDLLMTYVLQNMDIELSPFYKWLYTTKDKLPSSNYVVAQDNDGKKYFTLNLEGEMKEMYDLREKVQYMLFK